MPMGGLSLEVIRLRFLRIAPWWGSSLEEGFGQKSILAVSRSLVPSYGVTAVASYHGDSDDLGGHGDTVPQVVSIFFIRARGCFLLVRMCST